MQIFYLLVAVGGYALYYCVGIYPHFPNSYVSWHHHWLSFVLASLAFFTYYKACKQEPGIINKKNSDFFVRKYKAYYDNIIFDEGKECTTCKVVK